MPLSRPTPSVTDDVEQAADAHHGVEPRQIVGDRDGAFLAPAQPPEAAGLCGVRRALGVVGEAVGGSRSGAIWQGWPSALA